MSDRRVLIDTGAIFALVTRTDAHHRAARAFVEKWLRARGAFVLADVVFAETMTLLKARVGADVAVRAGQELRENPTQVWTPLGADGERDTWATFQRYQDKAWSYTDCALLSLSRSLKIGRVFAFDHHFDQMPGLTRVPLLPAGPSGASRCSA